MDGLSPKYLAREAIESLNNKLKLRALSPYSQDWEYEQADSSRLQEFIRFYEENLLTNNEKYALMALIISSFDDYLSEGRTTDDPWNKIREQLLKDSMLHRNTIIYWALEENELEDCFAITPLIREILHSS